MVTEDTKAEMWRVLGLAEKLSLELLAEHLKDAEAQFRKSRCNDDSRDFESGQKLNRKHPRRGIERFAAGL